MFDGVIIGFDATTGHGLIRHDDSMSVWPFLGADCGGLPTPGRDVQFQVAPRQFGNVVAMAAINIQ